MFRSSIYIRVYHINRTYSEHIIITLSSNLKLHPKWSHIIKQLRTLRMNFLAIWNHHAFVWITLGSKMTKYFWSLYFFIFFPIYFCLIFFSWKCLWVMSMHPNNLLDDFPHISERSTERLILEHTLSSFWTSIWAQFHYCLTISPEKAADLSIICGSVCRAVIIPVVFFPRMLWRLMR